MKLTESLAARPPPVPPEGAARQTMHNSNPACATSIACTRPNPACPARFRCPAETVDSATATTRSIMRCSPQLQSPPEGRQMLSANPHALCVHTPSARTVPHHPPATAKVANMPETCSTPGWWTGQKRQAPLPPKSSTASESAIQNRLAAALHSRLVPDWRGDPATLPQQPLPPPADTDSTGTTTPDAASSTASRGACCNPADIAFPGIAGSVRLRNKTRRNRGAPPFPDSATPPEYATALRLPEITPAPKSTGTPASAAIPP